MSRIACLCFVILSLAGAAAFRPQHAAAQEIGGVSPQQSELKRWAAVVRSIVALSMLSVERNRAARTVVEFVVGADGHVETASLASSTGSDALDANILAKFRTAKFPPPTDRMAHKVRVPLGLL